MKIKKVLINNFKSIKHLEFCFPNDGILILVGENNAGKSNIIRAIDAVCGESWYGKEKLEDYDYYQKNKDNQIEIMIGFDDNKVIQCKPTTKDWGIKYYKNFRTNEIMPFRSNIKDDFPCTYLGADRTFDKHLSFYDWTLIGRIRKAFHKKVSDELSDEIKQGFNELVVLFDKVDGFKKFKEDFTTYFKELLPLTSTKIGIDFKPFTPSNLFKTMQILATEIENEGDLLDLNELGEGARNLILIALLRSYAKNLKANDGDVSGILALEEPELFLHPQARRHLFRILRELAATGIQVIISTHSDSFIDTEFFDTIGRVIKVNDDEIDNAKHTKLLVCSKSDLVNKCISTGVPKNKCNLDNITEFYKTTSNVRLNEGFFSRLLILVEGETEEMCIPIYLEQMEIDCDALGISIIPVQGKSQIAKYWRLYSSFQIPIIVVFDNDQNDGKDNANKQIATCFEISGDDIIDVNTAKKILGRNNTPLVILENDFESVVEKEISKDLYDNYLKQAKDIVKPVGNQQKGIISRYIARQILLEHPGFCPLHIQLIETEIRRILNL